MDQVRTTMDGTKITYYIQYKPIKNINLKVNVDKKIVLSVPIGIKDEEITEFMNQKLNWIKKQLEYYDDYYFEKENLKFEEGETIYLLGKQYKMKIIPDKLNKIDITNHYINIYIKNKYIKKKKYIRNIYQKWLKNFSMNIFEEILDKYYKLLQKYDVLKPKLEIRDMKIRWGSCIKNSSKVIFNTKLIKTPICCIEYVILHELCHFKYPNHDNDFYNLVTIFMPDWKERKKILDNEFCGVI